MRLGIWVAPGKRVLVSLTTWNLWCIHARKKMFRDLNSTMVKNVPVNFDNNPSMNKQVIKCVHEYFWHNSYMAGNLTRGCHCSHRWLEYSYVDYPRLLRSTEQCKIDSQPSKTCILSYYLDTTRSFGWTG